MYTQRIYILWTAASQGLLSDIGFNFKKIVSTSKYADAQYAAYYICQLQHRQQTQNCNKFLTRTRTECYFQVMRGDLGNRESEKLLLLLPTQMLSTNTSESDSGTFRLTTPEGFHFRPFKRATLVFLSVLAGSSYLGDSYWFLFTAVIKKITEKKIKGKYSMAKICRGWAGLPVYQTDENCKVR